jgi:hypothetical protein
MTAARSSLHSHAGPSLQRVLLSISQQAELDLRLLTSGDPQSRIHALRVRMKKLRAVLRLIQPGLAPKTIKAIRRHLRILKQAFAMNRDQHVLHALLAELRDGDTSFQEERQSFIELPVPAEMRMLQATAHKLTKHLQNLTLRPLAWDDIAFAYARRYAKARQWFRRCEKKHSAARMHRWRAPVKDHYFQSLIVLRDRHHLHACRKLGSWLGQLNDLALLQEHSVQCEPARLARAIQCRMKNLRARIFRKARHLFVLKSGKYARQLRAAGASVSPAPPLS